MTAPSPWVTRYMPALCAAAWLATLAAATWDVDAHWPLRVLLTGLAAALVTQIVRGPAPFVALSPFITLALIVIVFFSVVPALSLAVASDTAFIATMKPALRRLFTEFYSGQGEFIVLQFGAMCLAAAALLHRHMRISRLSATVPDIQGAARAIATGAVILVLSLSLVLVLQLLSAGLNDFLAVGIGRQIKDGIPPVVSFALATLFYVAAGRDGRWRISAVLLGLVAFGALIIFVAAKIAVFILLSCIALYILKARPATLPTVAVGMVAVLTLFGAIVIQGYLRNPDIVDWPDSSVPRIVAWPSHTLGQKLVMRQLVTSGCLQTVIEKRLDGSARDNPFYFFIAVVPRIYWRDKPNLSLGTQYARDYCGLATGFLGGKSSQTFSISLLGQPMIHAGAAGLITAQLFLLLALGLVTVICLRTGSAGIITLAALLPWLSDFDQSLMLYIANALKMFLYMSPVLVTLVIATRRAQAADTSGAR